VIFDTFLAMPILDKIRSIFQVSPPYSETRKKSTRVLQHLKSDVDPESVWEVIGVLGNGSFGKVYKVRAIFAIRLYFSLYGLFLHSYCN